MAFELSKYTDVYKVEDYEVRVRSLEQIIPLLGSYEIQEQKASLIASIKILQEKEKQLYDSLEIEGNTIQEKLENLNKNLNEYSSSHLTLLSGEGLKEVFLQEMLNQRNIEGKYLQEAVEAVLREEGVSLEQARLKGLVSKAVLTKLNELSKGNFSAKQGMTQGKLEVGKLSSAQKQKWKDLILQKFKDKNIPEVDKYLTIKDGGFTSTSFSTEVTWSSITKGLKAEDAKKLSDDEIREIKKELKKYIFEKSNSSDDKLFKQIVDHVFLEDKYGVFVGRNINGITGLLGEIQGLYYLAKIMGAKNIEVVLKGKNRNLQFLANDLNDKGKKSHRDILVNGFGIQVKNTTQDIANGLKINFASQNLETFLNTINVSNASRIALEKYYGTKAFNVPFHIEDGIFLPGLRLQDKNGKSSEKAAQFKSLYEDLHNMEDDVDKCLSLFAASLLYLDAEDTALGMDRNVLFLIGGRSFQAASVILQDILEKIESDLPGIHISSYQTTGQNIIDANNSKKYGEKNKDYSQDILQHVRLSSSYVFNFN